ncbi:MAG: sigma-54-dependent Fis family transcriptional regulator [Deltaproteobacteria bacterium]|nr:MAG: sigma-54-dependent Fis family transcriptional regulator [Deltaproteobacteria bacterium]
MTRYTLWVVDDDPSIRESISLFFGEKFNLKTFERAEPALQSISREAPDVVLLDVGLPGMSGIEALRHVKSRSPHVVVIMISAIEEVETVVAAMKEGAHDYVVKPLQVEGLEKTLNNALETIRLRKEIQALQERFLQENLPAFIAESEKIQDVMAFVETVAASPDTPVLLVGATGTGKELLARAIHYRSPVCAGPFIAVNCAAIPKDLIESELFGYEKGAFSGALESGKAGLIEEADGGTLFLDEVGDLSLSAQAKLLRFLDEGEFYRVGGTKKRRVRVRIVSATNRDLDAMMKEGTFREDLYFRLSVVKVEVPSLNERKDDILPLARHFLLEFSRKFRKDFTDLSVDAEKALLNHHYAGNVRELKNLIERGVLAGPGPLLRASDMGLSGEGAGEPDSISRGDSRPFIPPDGVNLEEILRNLERRYFEEALRMAKGNESRAARLLGLNHHTFRYRKKKLGIS